MVKRKFSITSMVDIYIFYDAMVKNRLTNEIREKSPQAMIFANAIALCAKSKKEVETKVEDK